MTPGRLTYDLLYGVGAASRRRGWDRGAGPELEQLLVAGEVSASSLPPGRAIDLGCGTGANVLLLAEHGFDAVGVDFSRVAIARGAREAAARGLGGRARFVVGDVTADRIDGVEGPFDLVVAYNTLQDLTGRAREAMAATVRRLTRPGGQVILWCYHADPGRLPVYSVRGPSRLVPYVVAPGEEGALFARSFDIRRLPEPAPGSGAACFVMTRR